MTRATLLAALATVAQTPGQPERVRLASNAADEITPILYALDHRSFARAGLDVEIARMNNGAAVTEAVVSGAIDFGSASLLPIIIATSRGLPLSLVAAGGLWLSDHPVSGLVVLDDAPITTPRELGGKTVGVVGLQDLTQVALSAWLRRSGVDARRVHVVELPGAASLAALDAGRIDAMVLSVPFLADVLASGRARVLGYPDDAIAPRFLISAWFGRRDVVHDRADVGARFAAVARAAATYTNAHPDQTLGVLAAFSGMAAERLRRMTRAIVALQLDPRDIQPVIDAAARAGLIAQPFPAAQLITS